MNTNLQRGRTVPRLSDIRAVVETGCTLPRPTPRPVLVPRPKPRLRVTAVDVLTWLLLVAVVAMCAVATVGALDAPAHVSTVSEGAR